MLAVERRLKGEDLKEEDMEKVMCDEYRQLNFSHMKKFESDSAVLLFTGVCYNCGKSGHCTMTVKRRMMVKEPRKKSF
jgi:hypothetical protein